MVRVDGEIYAELKRIARHYRHTRSTGATISTTELVHEAFLKLNASDPARWQSRAHFFGAASRAMRQVLVDYARNRRALKRGGTHAPQTLTDVPLSAASHIDDVLVLDDLLCRLRDVDDRLCRVVELRVFAGVPDEEIGRLLGISTRTVARDWIKARLFLARELARAGA